MTMSTKRDGKEARFLVECDGMDCGACFLAVLPPQATESDAYGLAHKSGWVSTGRLDMCPDGWEAVR